MGQQSYNARGTINPSRFVKMSAHQDNSVEQAGANENTVGISQEWSYLAPLPSAGTEAAVSSMSVKVYSIGETCMLELGGSVSRGGRIKADTDGKGVAIATTGTTIQYIGAEALESGSSGQLIRVNVVKYSERPALV